MLVRYWIGVVSGDHVDYGIANGLCAFSKGARSAIEKLSDGDRFAFYSPKTGFMEGTPIQAFAALGTVIDATPSENIWAGHLIWTAKAAYAEVAPAPVRPLLEPLSFVTNPAKWGMAFRRGQFEISHADFELIETAMKAGQKHE